jgi:ATP-dependent DNA helicase DinG
VSPGHHLDDVAAEQNPPATGISGRGAAGRATAALESVTANLPGGEVRSQQLEMCGAVEVAMASGRHLVVQAGTGTGKSLAYLVPAVLSGKRVVVATATKALQDQLASKDLPLVADSLDAPFSFAVLKGRSNYLCRQRAAEVADRGFQQSLVEDGEEARPSEESPTETTGPEEPGPGHAGAGESGETGAGARPAAIEDPGRLIEQVQRLLRWAEETDTGDRADLSFEPHPRAWSMLSVGPRECPGAFRCPSGPTCFTEAARAAAASADVVVVNTHLYGAHLASGGAVLPPHEVVVFDEAHELEEVMTASLGVEVAPGRFRALATMSRPLLGAREDRTALDDLTATAEQFHGALADRVGTRVLFDPTEARDDDRSGGRLAGEGDIEPDGRERTRRGPRARTTVGGDPAEYPAEVRAEDDRLRALLELAASRLADVVGRLRRAGEQPSLLAEGPDDVGQRARALSAGGHLIEDIARFAVGRTEEVAWVDGTRRAPLLRLSPIDVGPPLAGLLWDEVTAVLTSATIPQRLSERLGLDGSAVDELDVGSPFDYRTHALLYVARHLPDRRRPESEPALFEELAALIRAAGGRTLALFTSRRTTELAASSLQPLLSYRVLVQGALPKGRLLRLFAEDESSCLFATMGFWQGVDVPGRALSLVALDRLPFGRPDDPLLQARRDRAGDAAFRVIDLPRAATLLAQGAGRLIRSADDYGVVAVLDPRLATAGYRRVLLAGLPPMRRTTDRRQVEDFLGRILTDEREGSRGAQ